MCQTWMRNKMDKINLGPKRLVGQRAWRCEHVQAVDVLQNIVQQQIDVVQVHTNWMTLKCSFIYLHADVIPSHLSVLVQSESFESSDFRCLSIDFPSSWMGISHQDSHLRLKPFRLEKSQETPVNICEMDIGHVCKALGISWRRCDQRFDDCQVTLQAVDRGIGRQNLCQCLESIVKSQFAGWMEQIQDHQPNYSFTHFPAMWCLEYLRLGWTNDTLQADGWLAQNNRARSIVAWWTRVPANGVEIFFR